MKTRLLLVVSLIALAVCGMGNIARGQNDVTESATTSFYGTSKALQLAPGERYITWEVFGVVVSDTGQGLFHGTTMRCIGTHLIGKESWESESYCSYTMKDGEKVFATAKQSGKVATPPVPGKGTGKFIGGTGKYSAIQGETEIVSNPLRPAAEGILQSYNKVKFTYKLP